MTGIAELHAQALDATGRILRGVPADNRYSSSSPEICSPDATQP